MRALISPGDFAFGVWRLAFVLVVERWGWASEVYGVLRQIRIAPALRV